MSAIESHPRVLWRSTQVSSLFGTADFNANTYRVENVTRERVRDLCAQNQGTLHWYVGARVMGVVRLVGAELHMVLSTHGGWLARSLGRDAWSWSTLDHVNMAACCDVLVFCSDVFRRTRDAAAERDVRDAMRSAALESETAFEWVPDPGMYRRRPNFVHPHPVRRFSEPHAGMPALIGYASRQGPDRRVLARLASNLQRDLHRMLGPSGPSGRTAAALLRDSACVFRLVVDDFTKVEYFGMTIRGNRLACADVYSFLRVPELTPALETALRGCDAIFVHPAMREDEATRAIEYDPRAVALGPRMRAAFVYSTTILTVPCFEWSDAALPPPGDDEYDGYDSEADADRAMHAGEESDEGD